MFLQLFAILFTIEETLSQNCQLNATHMDRKWIYATGQTTGTWDVLHTDYIKDQNALYLICNAMTNVREILCNHGSFQEGNPMPTCSGRIRAETVALVPNENSCRRMNGQMYRVRYTLPNNIQVTLYDVCYSTATEQSLYTRHKSYGFNLAASTYRRPKFSRGTVVSRERELSFEAANIYNTFVRLLGANQTYIPNNKTLILEHGHFVNSQDFPSYDQMDETFKYVNVVPQFRGSNRSNWKRIENWIHNLPSSGTYAEVVTGSFDILTLQHSEKNLQVPLYLMANQKNPIPLWTYKVVKYASRCYAFITLNNDFNTDPDIAATICPSVTCPSGLQFSKAPNSGISYCCNYNYFVRYIGRHALLC